MIRSPCFLSSATNPLWKRSGHPNAIPGWREKCSASRRNRVHHQPGTPFGIIPESCSASSRNGVHDPSDSPCIHRTSRERCQHFSPTHASFQENELGEKNPNVVDGECGCDADPPDQVTRFPRPAKPPPSGVDPGSEQQPPDQSDPNGGESRQCQPPGSRRTAQFIHAALSSRVFRSASFPNARRASSH